MRKQMLGVAVLAVFLMVAGAATADTFVLKEQLGAGYTYCDTLDTQITRTGSGEEYNFGAVKTIRMSTSGSSWYYGGVIRFDLSAIPVGGRVIGVKGVNSATLRMYRLNGDCGTLQVNQMTQTWDEGTSNGDWGQVFDGAGCYASRAGTNVSTGTYQSTVHATVAKPAGVTVYYFDNVTDLAEDPAVGTRHYIARWEGTTFFRNWDLINRRMSQATSLDDLVDNYEGHDRAYYYDDPNDRVYLSFNNRDTRYFETTDLWVDSVWDGSQTKGILDGSIDSANTYTDAASSNGWYEVGITPVADNWLVDGDPNYGVRLRSTSGYSQGTRFVASERTEKYDPVTGVWEGHAQYLPWEGIYVQPELVLDVEMERLVPEPAGLGLLGLALLGLRRKRR